MMKKIIPFVLSCLAMLAVTACSDDEETAMKNDLIKRTVSPLVAGEKIEFAFAAGTTDSKLKTFTATASAPGGDGTNFEPYAWRTENGTDISETVATDCKTEGSVSTATITDAQATTLCYYYVIPQELKGQKASFIFSATTQNGETTSYRTPAYTVSMMDMRKMITLSGQDNGARYFSIEDMKAYTRQQVEQENLAGKIDFIYAYEATKNVGDSAYTYKHAFFAPGAEDYYPDSFVLPAGWPSKQTLMDKKLYVWDGQLKDDVNNNIRYKRLERTN